MINIFGNIFETHEVTFETYIEDKLNSRQTIEAPEEIIILNFIKNAEKIKSYNKTPLKMKMIKQVVIWDDFEQKQKMLNNEIELSNDAMVAWEGNGKGGGNDE